MAVNGKKYSYENIQVALAGKPLVGCVAIEYDLEEDSSEVHVLGSRDPHAVISGKGKYMGKITLVMDEYDALQMSIEKGRSITDIAAFEIVIARLGANDILMTDVIKKVKFNKVSKKFEAGQTADKIELPFTAGGIDYNV